MGKWSAWALGLCLSVFLCGAPAHDFGGSTTPEVPPGLRPDPPCSRASDGCCPDPQAGVGDPVSAHTGNLYLSYTDVEIGSAFPIRLVRKYDSFSEYDTALGYGWAFEHDRRLFEYPDGSVIIRSGCGRRDRFVNTGGTYVTPRDAAQGQLMELQDGSYEYRYPSGKRDRFDADGRLVEVTNRSGQRHELLYDPRGRLPLVGTSPRAVDPSKPMVVAYQPRLTRIQERGASGALTGYWVSFDYNDVTGRLTRVVTSDGREIAYGHDETAGATRGNLRTVAGLTDYVQAFSYTDPLDTHNITAIVDGIDATPVVNTYNNKDQVTRQVEGGTTWDLAYLAPGRTQTTEIVTNAAGVEIQRRISVREFDEAGYLTKLSDAAGHEQRFAYSASKDRIRTEWWEKQPDGTLALLKAVNSTYNGQSQKLTESVTLDSGETVTAAWTYDSGWVASEQRSSTASAQIFRTEYEFHRDGQGMPINVARAKRRNDDGTFATTTFTYCSEAEATASNSACPDTALLKQVDGPRTDVADITTYLYYSATDVSGCAQPSGPCHHRSALHRTVDALGHTVEVLRYDAAGRPVLVRDANSASMEMTYDVRGRLLQQVALGADDASTSDDRITRYEYDARGNLKRKIEPNDSFLSFEYDGRNRLIKVRDTQGGEIRYTLDSAGNQWKEETFDGAGVRRRVASRSIDVLDRPLTLVGSQDQTTRLFYDGAGRQLQLIDALGAETTQAHDDLDRVVGMVSDAGTGGINASTQLSYDANGNVRRVIDPKGLATTYQLDALGRLTQLSSPDTGITYYTYDAAGNRRSQVDARGEAVGFSYDASNRLVATVYSDDALNVIYSYDVVASACQVNETFAAGRLGVMTDGSGSTQYCYNRFGELVRMVQTTGTNVFTVRYAYTKTGQVQAMIYPDGTTVDYDRDTQGRINEVGVALPQDVRRTLVSNATYYPFGPSSGWTYGVGDRSLVRQHDLDYQPQVIRDTAAGGLDLGFRFDAAGRLAQLHTAALSDPPRARFGYDALGRLTQFRDGPTDVAVESYTYDATGNRTSLDRDRGFETYSYFTDSHRLSAVGDRARTYDAAGNTIAIDNSQSEHSYSPAGRLSQSKQGGIVKAEYYYNGRGEQVLRESPGYNTFFAYSKSGNLLGQYRSDGSPIQQYLWLENNPVGVLADGKVYYVQPDHVGSPRAVIDSSRSVSVWRWDLRGEVYGDSMPNTDADSDGVAFIYDLRFPGQRHDSASGLSYNYYRNYEPLTGRYVESDPVGLIAGLATYTYAESNPLSFSDPYGLQSFGARPGGGNAHQRAIARSAQIRAIRSNSQTNPLDSRGIIAEKTASAQNLASLVVGANYTEYCIVANCPRDAAKCGADDVIQEWIPSIPTTAQLTARGCTCLAPTFESAQGIREPSADWKDLLDAVSSFLGRR